MAASAQDDDKVLHDFAELQEKVLMQSQAASKLQHTKDVAERRKKVSLLTKQELEVLPADTVTYKAVGRAYFVAPKADCMAMLDARVSECDAELKKCKEQSDAIELKFKDTETQLRELLSQSPQLARRLGAVRI